VLIANRGEIARRIIRTCRKLGVRAIAVYSEADARLPFVREADEAVLIGPAPARESYLVAEKILAAARQTGAEAIHPGYGFLSENAAFARAVKAAGLVWVGPPPQAIEAMGLKDAAKKLMANAGVPVTPGYLGEDQSAKHLAKEAKAIGFPVLIKAVAGGGGKGMRRVDVAADFDEALAGCKREAAASFGDDRVLIEKYVTRPRHIEVQVFGDSHGNVVHLFERDCSLQRRHQKVIEEAPAPGMDEATRAAVCGAAVKAAQAVTYEGAGTVEFIADASEGLKADRIWFMEMNTRLQVEHPVTEMITGLDLVEWQLRVASGEPLPLEQSQIRINGHAMEARLYAENPASGFLPSIGRLVRLSFPLDARIDSAVEAGDDVSPHYDPMIAKIIVHAETREAAADKLAQACGDVVVWPVKTNAGFLRRCALDPGFRSGEVDTGLIAARGDALTLAAPPSRDLLDGAAGRALWADDLASGLDEVWSSLKGARGFRLNAPTQKKAVDVWVDGVAVQASPSWPSAAAMSCFEEGSPAQRSVIAFENGDAHVVAFRPPAAAASEDAASDGAVRSPMPGRIVSVAVKRGDKVKKGQTLLVLTAMKMEHALAAPVDGEVAELTVEAGDQTMEGSVLVRIQAG
jgi:propionyl-CoA carboxylase alpha chain/3-methylcrotonyl-CoA carboxylase alpha subunit